MFRGDLVGQGRGLLLIASQDEGAAGAQGGGDDLLALHGRQETVDGSGHLVEVGRVPGNQDGLGVLVVFGLREEVHGDPFRGRAAVAEDEDLRGAGHHVDTHLAEDGALGGGDVDIARANDLVHRRHRRGAIGQCRHRLGAADGEDPVDAGGVGRRQHEFVQFAGGGGHHHDQLRHPGHLGGDGVHQHRGGIGRLAAGDIEPHPVQGSDLLAEEGAVGLDVAPAGQGLVFRVGADAPRRRLQGGALGGGDGLPGLGQPGGWDLQVRRAGGLPAVEAAGIVQQGRVTPSAQVANDGVHGLLDLGVGDGLPGQQGLKLGGKVRVGGGESADVGHVPYLD